MIGWLILGKILLKYGSEEKGSSFCKCSIFLGFIMLKNLRGLRFYVLIKVQNATSLVFFYMRKPRKMEHLHKEECSSSDPYFSSATYFCFLSC